MLSRMSPTLFVKGTKHWPKLVLETWSCVINHNNICILLRSPPPLPPDNKKTNTCCMDTLAWKKCNTCFPDNRKSTFQVGWCRDSKMLSLGSDTHPLDSKTPWLDSNAPWLNSDVPSFGFQEAFGGFKFSVQAFAVHRQHRALLHLSVSKTKLDSYTMV